MPGLLVRENRYLQKTSIQQCLHVRLIRVCKRAQHFVRLIRVYSSEFYMYLYFYQKPDKFLLQINIFIPALGYILILHAISDISFLVPDDLSDPTCRICTACHDISNNIWKKDVSLRHELYTLSFPYPLFVYCYCYAKCY